MGKGLGGKKERGFWASVFFAFFLPFALWGCADKRRPIRIINWNVQTFFDAQSCGTEYAEFLRSPLWNREKYERRLKRLCAFIKENSADIYVFEEVENETVLQDIAGDTGISFFSARHITGFFSGQDGSSLGIAVLSALPIKKVSVHQIDVRALIAEDGSILRVNQPSLRALLQMRIETKDGVFILFACHWKSKSGGAQKSELWRNLQEKLLVRHINALADSEGAMPVIVCGDFNRPLEEFTLLKGFDLKNSEKNGGLHLIYGESFTDLYSAWLIHEKERAEKPCVDVGSYYFREKWEKIDHFFLQQICVPDGFLHS